MTLASGSRLGPYEILAPIGSGGMGEVYRARDSKLDRNVAVKVLPQSVAADPDTLARFEREAKAVAALSHPNILAIHDFGNQDGIAYAVMELLEGDLLRLRPDFAAQVRTEFEKWWEPAFVESLLDGLRKAGLEISAGRADSAAAPGS